MKILFPTAVGVLTGLLFVGIAIWEPLQNSVGFFLFQLVHVPGFAVLALLSGIGILRRSGCDADLFDWWLAGIMLQWTLVGIIWGCVLKIRDRKLKKKHAEQSAAPLPPAPAGPSEGAR